MKEIKRRSLIADFCSFMIKISTRLITRTFISRILFVYIARTNEKNSLNKCDDMMMRDRIVQLARQYRKKKRIDARGKVERTICVNQVITGLILKLK